MKIILLLASLAFLTSCQDTNSNSNDRARFSPIGEDPLDPNFGTAYRVITNRCISCHYHTSWIELKDSASWAKRPDLIIPGDSTRSFLISKIVNSGGNGNMPPNTTSIPDTEYQAIIKWANEMNPALLPYYNEQYIDQFKLLEMKDSHPEIL